MLGQPVYIPTGDLAEVRKRLTGLPPNIQGRALNSALRRVATKVRDVAKQKVRVKTGQLRENIIVAGIKRRALKPYEQAVQVTVRFGNKQYRDNKKNRAKGRVGQSWEDRGILYYSRFLEFGTSKMDAKPFLRPAFDETGPVLPDMFKRELAVMVERYIKKVQR